MSLVDSFWAAPSVTRTWAASVFVISIATHAGMISARSIIYHPFFLAKFPPDLWRLVTSFCYTRDLGIVFDPYMIWIHSGSLERDNRFNREPGKYVVYLVFIASFTLLINSLVWDAMIFTHPCLMGVVYTWCQENRGQPTNIYFITLDAKFLWPALLFVTFLAQGWQGMFLDLGGIVAAHLYDFLTIYWPLYGGGFNVLKTPTFVGRWFGNAGTSRDGQSTNVYGGETSAQATSTSAGVSSWNARGHGRRLGGD